MFNNYYYAKQKFVPMLIALLICALMLTSCSKSRKLPINQTEFSFPLTVGAAYSIAEKEMAKETSEYYIKRYSEQYSNWNAVINNSPNIYLDMNTFVNGAWRNVSFSIDSATGDNLYFPNQGRVPPNEEYVVNKLPETNYQLYALLTHITRKLNTDIQTLLLSKANSPSFYVSCTRNQEYFIIRMDDNSAKDPREILSIEYDSVLDSAKVFERDYSKVTPTPKM